VRIRHGYAAAPTPLRMVALLRGNFSEKSQYSKLRKSGEQLIKLIDDSYESRQIQLANIDTEYLAIQTLETITSVHFCILALVTTIIRISNCSLTDRPIVTCQLFESK
jgi:hypothetical protein